ncbi:zinc-dependent metalloprotease [Calothrix sp. UHCC 0171]|uniref:zinc-dependent metalloprotease n=1 Tax=Calothrix sp. UHCC 0171 TaxID=3110245 RepID=UPI002B1F3EEA|nr:zinc-dependent metalloprotease [Calothrix sp. UHCC 0171]MEA5569573.1 zinc-dependent metalloprotease [Calothrix sp. UHCC 0171]
MKDWRALVATCGLLLYNCLFIFGGMNGAFASQLEIPQLEVMPVIESMASADTKFIEVKEDLRRYRDLIQDSQKLEGLFTLYQDEERGGVLLEIQPEQLNKNYLATATLESGIGESGIYSGLPLQDFLFYFQLVQNRLQFVVKNVKFRTDKNAPEVISLKRSFSDSVLFSLDIIGIEPRNKSLLVSLDELLMQDFPGLNSLLKHSLHADYQLDPSKSYLSQIQSFPLNIEIDSNYGFSALEGATYLETLPDSRSVTLSVHYSFSQLPENNGYIPRLADDRVGYFITAFQDFSSQNKDDIFVRYINRWHLEPVNPLLAISPPKKQIIFWIENAVPLEYRDAIKEGVLMWNQAFTQAGFENAIAVRQMPDNADWHPADIRYNTIRWFNSLDAGFARGPTRVNPLTGEILDADIIIDAGMVRAVESEYRALVGVDSVSLMEDYFKNQKYNCGEDRGEKFLKTNNSSRNDSCYGADLSFQASMGVLASSLLPDMNTSPQEKHDAVQSSLHKYIHEYLRYLVAHEVGHTLGLRHNFHGSTMLAPQELNNPEITHTKGLVGSIMDYLPVNIAPQGVPQGDYFPTIIGPYDEWAITYGYKHNLTSNPINPAEEKNFLAQIATASPEPELSYATDEDIRDINPLANVWDMSSNVLLYSQWQLDNARLMWDKLDKNYPLQGDSYSNLRVLFQRIFRYYDRNAFLLVKYIGGQSFTRNHTSENTTQKNIQYSFVPVPKLEQEMALSRLIDYVFAENAFNFSPQLLNQLAPSRWQHWGNYIPTARLDYPIHERIFELQSAILRSLFAGERLHRLLDIELKTTHNNALTIPELFETLQNGIWSEVLIANQEKSMSISSIRRAIQREHLHILLEMVLRKVEVPEDGRTIAWYELRQLKKAISRTLRKSKNLDLYTLAHLEESNSRIHKILNAELKTD